MPQIVVSATRRRRDESSRRAGSVKPRGHRFHAMADPGLAEVVEPTRLRRRRTLVLIVDDAAQTRELYAEYLTFRGLLVVGAPDAETGLALARTLRPDVIVMDLAMPRLNGIGATQRLKHDPHTRRIPVIVLTGYAFRAIEQGVLEAGASVFLTKPCLPEDLELQIRQLLRSPDA
jgi:two-component system cell cycle response regulator DivK